MGRRGDKVVSRSCRRSTANRKCPRNDTCIITPTHTQAVGRSKAAATVAQMNALIEAFVQRTAPDILKRVC